MTTAPLNWDADPRLTEQVDQLRSKAVAAYRANPNLVEEHANHEESIRVGGYANRTLLELIQNGADALAGSEEVGDSAGRIEIVLDETTKTLYCANAGRPFSKAGITSISHAHLSAKRGDEIGRFGLGFKSVLAVTRSPQVFSSSVSFGFNLPESKTTLSDVSVSPRVKYPVLRTPVAIDAAEASAHDPVLAELGQWASTVVRLPDLMNTDRLRGEIENFDSEFLLFVEAVRLVRLRVIGERPYETSHRSRDLGDGFYQLERPDGPGEKWVVAHGMHRPSSKARIEVGEAVSRAEIKVSVALPLFGRPSARGRFWSYFPLQDETTATALLNAPWSVNDDRTTLLRNEYNKEILDKVSEMFVEALPKVIIEEDPARHLDFMPARGREALSFGDDLLSDKVPRVAAQQALIPDIDGALSLPSALRPLDFLLDIKVEAEDHRLWSDSPNTGRDAPHWTCYLTTQRISRLRQMFLHSEGGDRFEASKREITEVLTRIPHRTLLAWLREWAHGEDLPSARDALKFVASHPKAEDISKARVLPTTAGFKAVEDKSTVFLEALDDVHVEGGAFVLPEFLAIPGVAGLLRQLGFRELDPLAILNSRLAVLAHEPSDEDYERFWDATLDVSYPDARNLVGDSKIPVKVPTADGGWAWPQGIVDVPTDLGQEYAHISLDRARCQPPLARFMGVVHEPWEHFPYESEMLRLEYERWVLASVNDELGPGDRPVERIDLYAPEDKSPGPFSMLIVLKDAGAPPQVRAEWTAGLLAFRQAGRNWTCADADSNAERRVPSPIQWAVSKAGLVRTKMGYRPRDGAVDPSMLRYEHLLPLFVGPSVVAEVLSLPKSLNEVPAPVLRESLARADVHGGLFPPQVAQMPNDVLNEFIIEASRRAFPETAPPTIPARVGRVVESRPPSQVFIAVDEEQRQFLLDRGKAFLVAAGERASDLIDVVGCKRFEDNYSFSILTDGLRESDDVLDLFPGFRGTYVAGQLEGVTITRAERIAKRVTTAEGVEDQSLNWHRDQYDVLVSADAEPLLILEWLNSAFQLKLSRPELGGVLKAGIDEQLENWRTEGRAATSDAERLVVYFDDETLKEALPVGLWLALEQQGLVGAATSVAELFLTVYGSDAVRQLKDSFTELGYTDVPKTWAGSSSAISWLAKMGFGPEFAGHRSPKADAEFVVPGAVILNPLHEYQRDIGDRLAEVLTQPDDQGRAMKAMVELPTGAGKTRVATETVLRLFIRDELAGTILWVAQSQELCEQAVKTWSNVWRGLRDPRPLTIGRLWGSNEVHKPETDFAIIVATDAKLDSVLDDPEYTWLRTPTAVIVDEGHRAGDSQMYTRLFGLLGVDGRRWERPLVGLSATPFKGRSESGTASLARRFGNRILKAFSANPYSELANLGVLAKVEHQVLDGVDVQLSADEIMEARDLRRVAPGVLDRLGRDERRLRTLTNHILQQPADWPILVFTPSVLSAQVLAATLRYQGREAAAVSGQTGRHERHDVIDRFKRFGHSAGEDGIQILVNCDLLVQGFDAPAVRALYIARPTFSPNAYIQMAGRGLRGPANGGKTECLIVDMADNFGDINEFLGFREYEELWEEHA